MSGEKTPDPVKVERATAADIILPPGKYVLKNDVTNPHYDKRMKRDWRYSPKWEKGTKFIVDEHSDTFAGVKITYRRLGKYGDYSYQHLPVRKLSEEDFDAEKFMALFPELERVTTENLGDIFTGKNSVNKSQAIDLLALLMDRKKVTFEDVRRAANALNELDEAAYDELEKRHQIQAE